MKTFPLSQGPYLADNMRIGDPYELSNGHLIECFPTSARGSKAEGAGYKVLSTDPGVKDVGIDTGYSPRPDRLRAPDLSAGTIPDTPGWVKGAPRLAVEYADVGQDEKGLAEKIAELLEAGTELIWVVRLTGPRRVEIHRPGRAMELAHPGDQLEAPGILKHHVLVESLYDEKLSNKVALRNLLEREEGSEILDQTRAEAERKTLRTDVLEVFEARGLTVSKAQRATIAKCRDIDRLRGWLRAAVTAGSAREVLGR